jgi:hypothetical protein
MLVFYFANTLYGVDQECGMNLPSVQDGYFEVTARRKNFVVKDTLQIYYIAISCFHVVTDFLDQLCSLGVNICSAR